MIEKELCDPGMLVGMGKKHKDCGLTEIGTFYVPIVRFGHAGRIYDAVLLVCTWPQLGSEESQG